MLGERCVFLNRQVWSSLGLASRTSVKSSISYGLYCLELCLEDMGCSFGKERSGIAMVSS